MAPPHKGQWVGGKYELDVQAGEGGMATVWRAVTRGAAGFRMTVAVKMIKPEFRDAGAYVAMFVEEARVGAELQHANIVQVHDFGVDEGQNYYLVMEWVDGMSLLSYIDTVVSSGGKTSWPTIAAVAIEALRGLGAAHGRLKGGQPAPVIHRDVSPENILLGVNGAVKLSDFGFARAKDRIARLTEPGTIKGKVSFIAPEMARGEDATVRSDLWSMGVVLWESLAGKKLFHGEYLDIFRKLLRGEVTPLQPLRPDLPAKLVAIVHHALEPDPAHRFQSAQEMAEALASLLRTQPRISDGHLGRTVAETRQARLERLGLAAKKSSGTIPIHVDPAADKKTD